MMPMFSMRGGFTSEESLVHDGAVGARLIQASDIGRKVSYIFTYCGSMT
jgi:hypothetical protein